MSTAFILIIDLFRTFKSNQAKSNRTLLFWTVPNKEYLIEIEIPQETLWMDGL